jgi:glycerophosphoryl diester phosphodiesterase
MGQASCKRFRLLALLSAWGLLALGGCGDDDGSEAPTSSPVTFFSGAVPRNIAHSGGKGHAPENTLLAFESSVELGAQILETDVWSTQDGEIVMLHDETVDRTTDGTGSVNEKTLAEVKELDAGWWFTFDDGDTYPFRGQGIRIPTLEEAFEAFPNHPFIIEIKQESPPIEQAVLSLIDTYEMEEKVCLASFHDRVVERVREINPDICTSGGVLETFVFMALPVDVLAQAGLALKAFQVPEEQWGVEVLNQDFVDKAVQLGIEVHVWTVNESDDMRRLLGMGVHGIITDFPDRLQEIIEE